MRYLEVLIDEARAKQGISEVLAAEIQSGDLRIVTRARDVTARVEQERRREFQQLRFGQAVQQQEGEDQHDLAAAEDEIGRAHV